MNFTAESMKSIIAVLFLMLGTLAAVGQDTPHAPLEQQKMCDVQAGKFFHEYWRREKGDIRLDNTSHFDPRMNICYILVIHKTITSYGSPSNSMAVFDAFEGREYASYIWINSEHKKFWEVKPGMCEVDPQEHDTIYCKSEAEFLRLVDKYFGIGQ